MTKLSASPMKAREEELKNIVAGEYFSRFNCQKIIGNIDFCVTHSEDESLLWAEAKRGADDLHKALAQLILTIGKAKTFNHYLPPPFLGAFNSEKIIFIPYNHVQDIFSQSDFNWNVTPSNDKTEEFKIVSKKIRNILNQVSLIFSFSADSEDLHTFIRQNFLSGHTASSKIRIDKNNFITVYTKWLNAVKESIDVDWEKAKTVGIIDCDFYLADLLSSENLSLKEKLYVLLKKTHYEFGREEDKIGILHTKNVFFKDNQKAHTLFWNKYERPPKKEYWDYIVERRDLLVPQDIRERKGSYFTPQKWVELSQRYMTDVLGENWQDEYYIWDCAAGTGNLLNGLTNKYNIWASTIDKQDVDVIKDRIKNGANLLEKHIFQFDFLNDDFSKLPQSLQEVIKNSEKRKKLVIYINPPYVEADNRRGKGRKNVAVSLIHEKYSKQMGYARREVFIQFLTRIFSEIKDCILADFSTLKNLQAPKFKSFRDSFPLKPIKGFLVPANTFDNVDGDFPIGFKIWDTSKTQKFDNLALDVYDVNGEYLYRKKITSYDGFKLINDWAKTFRKTNAPSIATIIGVGSDFQNQRLVRIVKPNYAVPADNHHWQISKDNLVESCVYYSVRHSIKASWTNDRDQFLFPNDSWKSDAKFKNDCLVFTLFKNNIKSHEGINHWIPFSESQVDAQEKFASHFMTNFMSGKISIDTPYSSSVPLLLKDKKKKQGALSFSKDAQAVLKTGLKLWKYYHAQKGIITNASYYDIREYFQGRKEGDGENKKGRMNPRSEDPHYTKLIADLRNSLEVLSKEIEQKVYTHGFLK